MSDNQNGISVIVPFLNEESAIPIFCETMDKYVLTLDFPVEIVFVNDGSTDGSIDKIKDYIFSGVSYVKLVSLSRNFGSHAAIRAGIINAKFDICTWIGADLQDPLDVIKIGYEKIKNGLNAVYFEKKTVKVSRVNRLFSKIYSYLMRKFAVSSYSSDGISTIVFGKEIRNYLNDNIEGNSSIILQIMNAGFKYDIVKLDYNERSAGKSKWTLSKKIKLFIDSFVSFSFMPIRFVSIVGIIVFLIGLTIGVIAIINKLVNHDVPIGYATIVSSIALGFGITNISLGVIAEYLWRTYDEARRRPVFIVSDIIYLTSAHIEMSRINTNDY